MLFLLLWACDGSDIVAVIPCKTPLVYYGTHLVNLWAMKVISLGLWCLQSPFCICSWCLNLVCLALASLYYGQVQPMFVVDDLLYVTFFRMRSAISCYTWKLHCSIWLFCIALFFFPNNCIALCHIAFRIVVVCLHLFWAISFHFKLSIILFRPLLIPWRYVWLFDF